MYQDANEQLPGIDLKFLPGKSGRIWGISGLDDKRGASFEKASRFLRDQAELVGTFSWSIDVELERVFSTSMPSLRRFFIALADLCVGQGDRRQVTVRWKIKSGAANMRSLAEQIQAEVAEKNPDNFTFTIN